MFCSGVVPLFCVLFLNILVPSSSSVVFSHIKNGLSDIENVVRSWKTIRNPTLEQSSLSLSAFSWSNCGSGSDLAKVDSLTVGPDPLPVPGNVTVSFAGSLAKTLQAPLDLSIELKKKMVFWVSIPCVDDMGSCDYQDICPLLAQVPCPEPFKKYGIPCQCPVKAGTYRLPTSQIELNPFGIPSWLETGEYKVTATLKQGDQEVLCMYVEFSLK